MRTIRTTTISILVLGLLAGSGVGVAAQDEEAEPFSGAVVTGYFASFSDEVEVPEFIITFPDGGEAVIRGVFTLTGAFDGSDDFGEVTISGADWKLNGVVLVNGPMTPEELAAE